MSLWLLSTITSDYKDGHEEAEEELPKKAKFFFSAAVEMWDAEFYVKVDDEINVDLGKHTRILSLI